jgi:hypothetical protein
MLVFQISETKIAIIELNLCKTLEGPVERSWPIKQPLKACRKLPCTAGFCLKCAVQHSNCAVVGRKSGRQEMADAENSIMTKFDI